MDERERDGEELEEDAGQTLTLFVVSAATSSPSLRRMTREECMLSITHTHTHTHTHSSLVSPLSLGHPIALIRCCCPLSPIHSSGPCSPSVLTLSFRPQLLRRAGPAPRRLPCGKRATDPKQQRAAGLLLSLLLSTRFVFIGVSLLCPLLYSLPVIKFDRTPISSRLHSLAYSRRPSLHGHLQAARCHERLALSKRLGAA